jgi:hypothetical protein
VTMIRTNCSISTGCVCSIHVVLVISSGGDTNDGFTDNKDGEHDSEPIRNWLTPPFGVS